VYRETLRLEKAVEIIGDGRVEEIVIESLQAECVSMAGEQALLRGLSLRGRAGSNGLKAYAVDIPRGRLALEECDITNDSSACVAIHGPEADPVLRGCRIHHGSSGGVFAYRGGKGILEDCYIYANARPGIAIQQGANPLIRHTRIADGQQSGVYIYDGGLGVLEHCEVSGNALTGIEIKQGGNPTIRNCRISANRYQAIYIHDGGLGRVENCDLSGNLRGAWRIDPDCQVERLSNRE
jgi:parallel beta-helix repeat protein